LLAELGARHLIRQPIEGLVDEYLARLDSIALTAAGGDRIPPTPLHLLPETGR
jgi:hypothetical protein